MKRTHEDDVADIINECESERDELRAALEACAAECQQRQRDIDGHPSPIDRATIATDGLTAVQNLVKAALRGEEAADDGEAPA